MRYEFFFMRADGSQLHQLGALYDSGQLRPVIDRTFSLDQRLEAMAYVEQGRIKAGKIVVPVAGFAVLAPGLQERSSFVGRSPAASVPP